MNFTISEIYPKLGHSYPIQRFLIEDWQIPQVIEVDSVAAKRLTFLKTHPTEVEMPIILGFAGDRIYELERWTVNECSCGSREQVTLQWRRLNRPEKNAWGDLL